MERYYYILSFDLGDATIGELAQTSFLKRVSWGYDQETELLHISHLQKKENTAKTNANAIRRAASEDFVQKFGVQNIRTRSSTAAESEGFLQHFNSTSDPPTAPSTASSSGRLRLRLRNRLRLPILKYSKSLLYKRKPLIF